MGDEEFNVGIATIIPWTLNVDANLTDAKGDFTWKPSHIKVKNKSTKYPVYFGLSGVLNQKLEPNEEVIIFLAIYYNVQGNNPPVRRPIRIKNWNPSSTKPPGCP